MRSIKILGIMIVVLTTICIGLWVYTSSLLDRSMMSEEQAATTESLEYAEENIPYMNITNKEVLYDVMPAIAPAVMNQIYVQNYEKDGLIDRYATIDGEVEQNNRSYTFTIHFLESDVKRKVTVTIINETTGNYDISVGDKL